MARPPRKPLYWIGNARDDLKACPAPVRDVLGKALLVAQLGGIPREAKRLKGDLGGLVELVDDFDGDNYRAVYTAKLGKAIYVLHVFQKKSTHGVATPQRHLQLIKQRLAWAVAHAKTLTEEAP
jgi:phage-related protein